MLIVSNTSIENPSQAEGILANLWQRCLGRGFALHLVGISGSPPALGVSALDADLELEIAHLITDMGKGAVEDGYRLTELLAVARDVEVIRMVPTDRHLAIDSPTFGWQRNDPLQPIYRALASLDNGMAIVTLSLRPLRNLEYLVNLTVMATGDTAHATVWRIAANYGDLGVRLRRPILRNRHRHAAERALAGHMQRPWEVKRVEPLSLFWHPPYESAQLTVVAQ